MKIDFIKGDKITIIDKKSTHYREYGVLETLSVNNPFALARLDSGILVKFQFYQIDDADTSKPNSQA